MVLPTGYHIDTMVIEIHSTIEYQDECDIKTIVLESVDVPIETRFNLKLAHMENRFERRFERRFESLSDQFEIKLERKNEQIDLLNKKIVELEHTNSLYDRKFQKIDQKMTFIVDGKFQNIYDRLERVSITSKELIDVTEGLLVKNDELSTSVKMLQTNASESNLDVTTVVLDMKVRECHTLIRELFEDIDELRSSINAFNPNIIYTKEEVNTKFTPKDVSNKFRSDIQKQTERVDALYGMVRDLGDTMINHNTANKVRLPHLDKPDKPDKFDMFDIHVNDEESKLSKINKKIDVATMKMDMTYKILSKAHENIKSRCDTIEKRVETLSTDMDKCLKPDTMYIGTYNGPRGAGGRL